jgi:hypothetical protein
MNLKFEDIRIEQYSDGYTLGYASIWEDYRGRRQVKKNTLAYWEMAKLIVSMGEIKIKNYIRKNFKLTEHSSTRAPIFETIEEAEKCYEWLKQKVFETTLVGKENIKAERDRKREEERAKRVIREKNKAIKDANTTIEKFQQYIGNEILFPVLIGASEMRFKATFLGILFDHEKQVYVVKTSAGMFEMHYKSIEIKDNEIVSLTGGYYHQPKIVFNGGLNIIFND